MRSSFHYEGNTVECIYAIEEVVQSFWGERLSWDDYKSMDWEREFVTMWGRKESPAFAELMQKRTVEECIARTQRLLLERWKRVSHDDSQRILHERFELARELARESEYPDFYLAAEPSELRYATALLLNSWYPRGLNRKRRGLG